MHELTRYHEDRTEVVVYRDGDDLVFANDYDDYGRRLVSQERLTVEDFLARGEGPWPWYQMPPGRREGALRVAAALGVSHVAWAAPLPADVLELFIAADGGFGVRPVDVLLEGGMDPDPLDHCGASPLWYALGGARPHAALDLLAAGADPGRRIDVSARGDSFTTILHRMAAWCVVDALTYALRGGTDPDVVDSGGATPMHAADYRYDDRFPAVVRGLAHAGADVDALAADGVRPIGRAALRMMPRTVTALIAAGAAPGPGLDTLLSHWATTHAGRHKFDAPRVVEIIELLLAAGAEVTSRHLALAEQAAETTVISALRMRENN
ncbi:hypothetical protein A7R75_00625 [Mycolicibacterium llatzerense]|nr:hypothetical protein [Mycolicibacterium llatzerense]